MDRGRLATGSHRARSGVQDDGDPRRNRERSQPASPARGTLPSFGRCHGSSRARSGLARVDAWLETMDFEVKAVQRTRDSKGQPRVAHLLLRRRAGG